MKRDEAIFGLVLAGIAALILWLLSRAGLLHESVTHAIGAVDITPQNTITPDPLTGLPRYDTRFPQTVPEVEAFAIRPIQSDGKVSEFGNAQTATCPAGYQKWINAANNGCWCLPGTEFGG